jgi:hypothetical protein
MSPWYYEYTCTMVNVYVHMYHGTMHTTHANNYDIYRLHSRREVKMHLDVHWSRLVTALSLERQASHSASRLPLRALVRLVVALLHFSSAATTNRPSRGFVLLYLGQCLPPLGATALLAAPSAASELPRVVGVRSPCCPPSTLPPCHRFLPVFFLPFCRVRPRAAPRPCLRAGPSPPFVALSHVNAACRYFLLHEHLELHLTCAPGGYHTGADLCLHHYSHSRHHLQLAPPPPPPQPRSPPMAMVDSTICSGTLVYHRAK